MSKFSCLLFALLLIVALITPGCKKEVEQPTTPVIPITSRTATLDKSAVTPGDMVVVTTSVDLDAIQSWEIGVGGRRLQLVKTDIRQAVFVVPVLPAGALVLDLTAVGVQAPPSLTMSAYAPIQDPDQVFTTFNARLTTAVTRLAAMGQDTLSPTAAQNVTLLRSLQQTFGTLQTSLSASEKLEAAYALQKMSFEAVDFAALPPRRLTGDPADAFIVVGQLFVDHMVTTVSCVGLFAFAIKAPEGFYTKIVAVAAAAAAVYQLAQATKLIEELANRFDLVASLNLTGSPGSGAPFTFSNGSTANATVSAVGRRMASADARASALLGRIFSSLERLQSLNQAFIDGYNRVRSWFGSGSNALAPYVTPLKDAVARRNKALSANLVRIRNVSNSAISVVATAINNTLTLRATSTITTRTPFTMDATYDNTALGISVTQRVNAEFVPNDSLAYFRNAVVGTWDVKMVWSGPGTNTSFGYDVFELAPNGTGRWISSCQAPTPTGCGAAVATFNPPMAVTWEVSGGGTSGYYLRFGPTSYYSTWSHRGRVTQTNYRFRTNNPLSQNSYALYSISEKR